MTGKTRQKAKARTARSGAPPAGKSKTRSKSGSGSTAKAKGGGPRKAGAGKTPRSTTGSGAARLRPGQLDGLVLGYMGDHRGEPPLTASAVAKGIRRSSGAVANSLERLAEAEKVSRAGTKPRAYRLPEPASAG
ncbi:MAG: hypothetical protein JSU06_00390 [Actinobacteria bacterium]|nr:hypothetical protein [Actinomycetota bacterium]